MARAACGASLENGNGDGSQTSTIAQVQQAATELEKAADAASTSPPTRPGVTRVQVEQPPLNISAYVMWGSLGVAAALVQVLLVLFLAYFLLACGDLYKRKLVKIVGPSLSRKKITVQILEDIDRQIAAFLFVQVSTSAAVGIATWIAFLWIGIEQAAVWGLLAGVFNTIPYFGPVIVTATAAVVAFLQFGTIEMALLASGGRLRDYNNRGVRPHTVAHEPRRADERRRRLYRSSLLGLGLGNLGDAARGADADGDEGRLRSRRGLQELRRTARGLTSGRGI